MARPSRFSPEVRERAVRMVFEQPRSTPHSGRRSRRSPRRSAARPRRCGTGCGRPSGTRPAARPDDGRTGAVQAARARERRAAAGERDPADGVGIFREGGARPPSEVMVGFIDAHRATYGVEPICAVLPIAPSLYYERKARQRDPAAPARAGAAGRRPGRAHPPRVAGEPGGLRGPQGLEAAAARRAGRGPLHGGAADAARWGSPARCAGGRSGGRRSRTTAATRPPDWSRASSRRRGRTSCGSRT